MIHAVDSESAQCKLAKTTKEKWKSKKKLVKKRKEPGKKRITKRLKDDQSDLSLRARESD